MKKGNIFSIIIGLALLFALMWRSGSVSQFFGQSRSKTTGTTAPNERHLEDTDDRTFKTKVGDRPPPSPAATHSPERLKDFFLPTLNIEGLSIEEAMQKLKASYQETCLRTGEVPINLKFDIPRGTSGKINIRLEGKSFSSAVKLLAALSGMEVSRKGSIYEFSVIPNELVSTTRTFNVPPDFAATLDALGSTRGENDRMLEEGVFPQPQLSEILSKLGLDLDPSTLVRPTNAGILIVKSNSAADLTVISQLVKTLADEKPMQLKFSSKIVELASGVDFELPDTSQMTDAEAQSFMRAMAQTKGTDLMSLPSVVTRNGESGNITIGREYILPKEDAEGEFETHLVGQAMKIGGNALGFGQETSFNFTDTTADDSKKNITIETQTDLSDTGFSNDQGTRFVIQENPDETTVIVLVTSTLIDATGEPFHGGE